MRTDNVAPSLSRGFVTAPPGGPLPRPCSAPRERGGIAEFASTGITLLISASLALFFLLSWFSHDATGHLTSSLPGGDGRPAATSSRHETIDLSGEFVSSTGMPADLPGSWTRFRGANSDNIKAEGEDLASSWGEGEPELLWSVDLGEGHAGPVILNGRVYLLDYDEEKRADVVRCLSFGDGREIWRRSYPVQIKRNHGMSRTVPAVTDDFVVTIGPRCHVVCLDSKSGDFRWGIDLRREYGTIEPLWYTGQCPLIENGLAILAPAGPETLLMAVDCVTGEVVWKTPNPNGWNMSHSSIMPMTIAGREMFVYCAIGGITGVSAAGESAGEILFELPWNAKVIAPSPVLLDDGRIFVTAGYGKGGMMLRVTEQGGAFSAEVLYEHAPKDGLACEQQTPIYSNGLLYGIMPKDAGALKGQFVCYRPDGSLAWSSGKTKRFGLGPFLLTDDRFLVLSDDGMLTLIEAGRTEYVQLAQAQVLDGHDAWGPMALAGRRLLLRDSKRMICLDIGPDQQAGGR